VGIYLLHSLRQPEEPPPGPEGRPAP